MEDYLRLIDFRVDLNVLEQPFELE